MQTDADECHRDYMLRLWQVQEEQRVSSHASLEDTSTGERRGFADLDPLFACLRNLLYVDAGPDIVRDGRQHQG